MLRASCHTLVGAPPVCSTAVAGSPLRWERCSEDTSLIFPFARMESCRKSIDKGFIRRVTYRSSRSPPPLRAGRRRTKNQLPDPIDVLLGDLDRFPQDGLPLPVRDHSVQIGRRGSDGLRNAFHGLVRAQLSGGGVAAHPVAVGKGAARRGSGCG